MEKRYELLVGIMVYNEEPRLKEVLEELLDCQKKEGFDVLIVDDGSTDNSSVIYEPYLTNGNWHKIKKEKNSGIGDSIRRTINYSRENNYKYLTIMSGNGKTKPSQLKRLYQDVVNDKYDYVKGSRYIENFDSPNLPFFRRICILIYSFGISLLMRKRITDVTCLINTIRLDVFNNEKMDISQQWLNKYEMEYYILYYVIKGKYRFKEVQMTIEYPKEKKNYSKIKPFTGWWSMIRPWILLILKIKR